MTNLSKRSTVYLEPELHKALHLKSIETSVSVSVLINRAIRESLAEDAEDLAAFAERVNEPLISYEAMLQNLKKNGRI
jgi:hypothetical protein